MAFVQSLPAAPQRLDSLLIVVQAQNELMHAYHDRILSTVYWSLGGLGVIAGVLLGYGWYANFRIYERDKAALRQELRANLQVDLSGVRETFFAALEDYRTVSDARYVEHQKQTMEVGHRAAESVRDSLRMDISIIRESVDELSFSLLEIEANTWRAKDVLSNELLTLVKMVRMAVRKSEDWRVSSTLDRIRQTFRDGVAPDAELSAELVEVLNTLPERFAAEVENLKTALRASRA